MDIEQLSPKELNRIEKNHYVTGRDVESLNAISQKTCNGFCIILDIKDSTKRKEDYKYHSKWVEQTRVFYNAFNALNDSLSKISRLQLVIQKFDGDGVMSFFKDSNSISTADNQYISASICCEVLKRVIRFKREIESEQNLCKMKIKTVVTYVTDINIVKIGEDIKKNDVLGLGIDFSYRIGQFSDIGYIVINRLLFQSLIANEVNPQSHHHAYQESTFYKSLFPIKINISGLGSYSILTLERSVKGWLKPQCFHIMVNEAMLMDMIEYLRSDDHDRSIYKELLSYYYSEHHEYEDQKEILQLPSWKNRI